MASIYVLVVLGVTVLAPEGHCCTMVGVPVLALGLFTAFLMQTFVVDRTTVLFFRDRIEIDLDVVGGKRNKRRTHAYTDVSHFERVSLSEMVLTVKPVMKPRYDVPMKVRPTIGEDLFDTIVEFLQSRAPEHIFSIRDDGHLRYSAPVSPLRSVFLVAASQSSGGTSRSMRGRRDWWRETTSS